jgi:hypothetical protein
MLAREVERAEEGPLATGRAGVAARGAAALPGSHSSACVGCGVVRVLQGRAACVC